jgi:hypothetical protein
MSVDPAFARRLDRWRAAHGTAPDDDRAAPTPAGRAARTAARLADALGGELVGGPAGTVVRIDRPPAPLPVDRERLARLPGHPGAAVPLVCLDTETTGLGTATGTFAFLVGLGWWEGIRFRQVQWLLPDHADEPALLAAVAAAIPPDAWLVTYNGRGFDWPLLETRYRLRRGVPPPIAGHLDLLPFARRVFRHRMPDARLRSVERHVLGRVRVDDVEGWEIPGRYFRVLAGDPPGLLADVVNHNHLDVRSLAAILGHVADRLADPGDATGVPAGDLAGLARAYLRAGRPEPALACLDAALARGEDPGAGGAAGPGDPATAPAPRDEDWWSPRRPADFGGRPIPARRALLDERLGGPWSPARIAAERARLLRRLGDDGAAEAAWRDVAVEGGRLGILAWIEVAKLREHRLGNVAGALAATERARALAERIRLVGRPEARLEHGIEHRAARLRRRLARRLAGDTTPERDQSPSREPIRSAAVG